MRLNPADMNIIQVILSFEQCHLLGTNSGTMCLAKFKAATRHKLDVNINLNADISHWSLRRTKVAEFLQQHHIMMTFT